MRILTLVILMAVNLGAALLMMKKMRGPWWIEYLILGIAGLVILGGFFGLWVDAEWAYPLMTIIFALSLANLLWLYMYVKYLTVFALGLLANITGVVISMTGLGGAKQMSTDEFLETYDTPKDEPLDHSIVMPKKAAKRGRLRKR